MQKNIVKETNTWYIHYIHNIRLKQVLLRFDITIIFGLKKVEMLLLLLL